MGLLNVSLEDKYRLQSGRVFMTGTQALVRLTLMQKDIDRRAGLNTAGYVTGYRGSPLGGLDREFGRAKALLRAADVTFHPAVNEDLAATAVWGSQQLNLSPGARFDGVFGIWYGKGPGVDRSGDVFRHANLAGTAPTGGVLALAGDDPACKSSTVPSHSEYALIDAMMPILHPANIAEILRFGLLGIQLSRYSGLWTALKCITDNIDTSASVEIDPALFNVTMPPAEGPPLNIRWPDDAMEQEARLHEHKLPAAIRFARANGLNHVSWDSPRARLGIAATGKTYMDVLQALDGLGIGPDDAARIGIRLYKVAMPWPLDPLGIDAFANGLEDILVVEEKRPVMEPQIKDRLFNLDGGRRPRVVGKLDEHGAPLLPGAGELTPTLIAAAIQSRLARFHQDRSTAERLDTLQAKAAQKPPTAGGIKRTPYFCSGCPHSTSTRVPEGSRAAAGIGCHYMALWLDRSTTTFTHMGGEGANWLGQAPFTETRHIFVNIGDGTYFHSGLMAIRAAVASGANMTYKILFNDAVAMTGGQTHDGPLSPAIIARQVTAEGASRVVVVTDEPDKYPIGVGFPPGTTVHHRSDLDSVQRDLRDIAGVSVLIYDQTCAAEKRRRRKRGQFPDPAKRVFINEDVCEGCGDCGVQSNCVSIVPKDTPLGRKRQIDQSSCNKDYTCTDGFCPSFVTVEGAEPRRPKPIGEVPFPALPDPALPDLARPYNVIVTGIGGTGVVTIGAVLGMAAHLEERGVSVLDIAGLAQKNGMVFSHLRFAKSPADIHAVHISSGAADVLLGCDMVTSCADVTLAKLDTERSRAAINSHQTMPADFTHAPDLSFPADAFETALRNATGGEAGFIEATELARTLMGDTIAANMMLVGYAFQKGYLPVSAAAIERAIELNEVAVDFNKQAFLWGRRIAHDAAAVDAIARRGTGDQSADVPAANFVEARAADLTAYQNAAYAARYRNRLDKLRTAESAAVPGSTALYDAAARSLYKLMAYKDEYEVARLYTDGRFDARLAAAFEDGGTVRIHLAPPLIAPRDPVSGHLKKRAYGPWIFKLMRALAALRGLRGTPFDPFGYLDERRQERRLLADFEALLDRLAAGLTRDNHAAAVQLAALPQQMRGFGHVKAANIAAAKACEADLWATFQDPAKRPAAAE